MQKKLSKKITFNLILFLMSGIAGCVQRFSFRSLPNLQIPLPQISQAGPTSLPSGLASGNGSTLLPPPPAPGPGTTGGTGGGTTTTTGTPGASTTGTTTPASGGSGVSMTTAPPPAPPSGNNGGASAAGTMTSVAPSSQQGSFFVFMSGQSNSAGSGSQYTNGQLANLATVVLNSSGVAVPGPYSNPAPSWSNWSRYQNYSASAMRLNYFFADGFPGTSPPGSPQGTGNGSAQLLLPYFGINGGSSGTFGAEIGIVGSLVANNQASAVPPLAVQTTTIFKLPDSGQLMQAFLKSYDTSYGCQACSGNACCNAWSGVIFSSDNASFINQKSDGAGFVNAALQKWQPGGYPASQSGPSAYSVPYTHTFFVWHQGESDACQVFAFNYQENLQSVVRQVASQLAADYPAAAHWNIIQTLQPMAFPSLTGCWNAVINGQIAAVVGPTVGVQGLANGGLNAGQIADVANHTVVLVLDNSMATVSIASGENVHLDSHSQLAMGECTGQLMAQLALLPIGAGITSPAQRVFRCSLNIGNSPGAQFQGVLSQPSGNLPQPLDTSSCPLIVPAISN